MEEYAELLHAIADGKQLQSQWENPEIGWKDVSPKECLREFSRSVFPPARYRIKPVTININGIEVPEPFRGEMQYGQMYWTPHFGSFWGAIKWINDDFDNAVLANGGLHLSEEAAEAHARALLSFTEVKS